MTNFYRIARNAFIESLREPIFFIMLYASLVIIGNLPTLTLFVFWEQLKLVLDSALGTTLVMGLLVVALTASNTIGREMRNGTVLLLMSKPVSRWTFIVAKMTGIIATGILFGVLCCFSSFIALYIATDEFRLDLVLYIIHLALLAVACGFALLRNFLKGSNFCEIACLSLLVVLPVMAVCCYIFKAHPLISLVNSGKAMSLVVMAIVIMSTLAVLFSTRFDTVPNLMLCSVLFFLGLISNYLFGAGSDNVLIDFLCGALYSILPNWQYFWMVDPVAMNRMIPNSYLGFCALYSALYVVICGMWAVALFAGREIAKDSR